jgi:MFS_1 like family
MVASSSRPLCRLLILYSTLYASFGAQSPFLPSLLESRILAPEAIASVLGAGTAIRLIAGAVSGRLADTLDAPKAVLAACSAVAALIAMGYLQTTGLWPLFVVGMFHSAALAPLAPLTDRLALGSAAPVNQTTSCSAAFIAGGCAAVVPRHLSAALCLPVRPLRNSGLPWWFG